MLFRHLRPGSHRDLEITHRRADATLGHLAEALDPGAHLEHPAHVWVDGHRIPSTAPLSSCGLLAGATISLHPVPVEAARRPSGAIGTTEPRHRTARPPTPDPPPAIDLPDPEPTSPAVTPIGVLAMAVSVIGAGVMVAVLGSWAYAAFAALGPLMVVANTVDSRFRRRRARRRYGRFLERELVRMRTELDLGAEVERAHRAIAFAGARAAEAIAASPVPSCWERRPGHAGAFAVRVGFGTGPFEPVVNGQLELAADEVKTLIEEHRSLADVALGLALTPGCPIAVVGPLDVARALVRSMLIQVAVAHGPADLVVGAVVAPAATEHWNWLAWLPHAVGPDGRRTVTTSGQETDDLLRRVAAPTGGRAVAVIDEPDGLRARRSAARTLLRAATDADGQLTCLVVLGPDEPVPAACTMVLRVSADGEVTGEPSVVEGRAVADLVDLSVATDTARRLARFDDPELEADGRSLPSSVRLLPLLHLDGLDGPSIAQVWRGAGVDPAPVAVLGRSADGPVTVDLVADGPHALVVGTTGSGKSEALRSLVLSLAASQAPDHLVFVLIDFKGGSAFDACADLPHTVGLVTDLDEQLAARALTCLEAELRHREARFRACGADDLSSLRRLDRSGEPLPRLVVVVDEFAALAASLPSFLDALVDVAQRGRSLGVHLVLATQRPGGAVTPAIRANIGLRVALRVQSADDSRDLIGSDQAAEIPRHSPGRAVISFGPGDVVALQIACASLPTEVASAPVTVQPLSLLGAAEQGCASNAAAREAAGPGEPTDMSELVDGLRDAWRTLDRPAPRRPWPDPLPEDVGWPVCGAERHANSGTDTTVESRASSTSPAPIHRGAHLVIGLADEPERQRIVPFGWELDSGPLLGVGLPGSGAERLASTVVLAAAARWSPEECHIHVLDATGSGLVALSGLPHVGAVVTSGETERQRRLMEGLSTELGARRAGTPGAVRVLVVHGVTALRARWEEAGHGGCWPILLELVADGARHGIHVCCTSESPAVPHRLVSACAQRLVFRLGDPADRAAFGLPTRAVEALPPGRALSPTAEAAARLVHIAHPTEGVAAAVARLSGTDEARSGPTQPPWIGVLPDRVAPEEVSAEGAGDGPSRLGDGSLSLPIGLADQGLVAARLDLPPGAHALVSGPPGSGRSTALAGIALAATSIEGLRVVVVAGAAPLAWPASVEVFDADDRRIGRMAAHEGPMLVLVDDADRTADDHEALLELATDRRTHRHLVAAGRNDRLRSRYGHWAREVRADGVGLLLDPDLDLDGDLLGVRLPRRPPVSMVPGRAWLSGRGTGAGGFVQLVWPYDRPVAP